ncbi:MAG: hypothetical protein QOJ02_4106 [Acidobacteriota bacterium]|jgi:hypothetical protein|nr:hypothetical protein [Acidobacteriota bacterium]
MSVQVIVAQVGPLPITTPFAAPGDAPMYLEVNGSVWTQSVDKLIGIVVALDGKVVGKAQIWSNGTATHRAVVPAYIKVQLTQGQHTLTLSADSNTISDLNDRYTAVLHF